MNHIRSVNRLFNRTGEEGRPVPASDAPKIYTNSHSYQWLQDQWCWVSTNPRETSSKERVPESQEFLSSLSRAAPKKTCLKQTKKISFTQCKFTVKQTKLPDRMGSFWGVPRSHVSYELRSHGRMTAVCSFPLTTAFSQSGPLRVTATTCHCSAPTPFTHTSSQH